MQSWWKGLFGPTGSQPRTRFTTEELRELYGVLHRNPAVNEANRAVVVETVRAIAEFMIWADQNEPRMFDFFLEHNIMTYLHRILLQPANRSGDVAKQVLQTLSIIIQNVKSETAIFFLFSNNHINNIVDLDFDFDDDEVLGYYISFLKTISLKLNVGTVQFFFDTTGGDTVTFPLYTRAVRLAHHREGMVRAAVRTLTLNVFSVDVAEIQSFVTSPPNDAYFGDVAAYFAEQVQLLDRRMAAAEGGSVQALSSLDSAVAEVEDVLSYCSDVLGLGVPCIAQLLAENLWNAVVGLLLQRLLLDPAAAGAGHAPNGPSAGASSPLPSHLLGPGSSNPSAAAAPPPPHQRSSSFGGAASPSKGGLPVAAVLQAVRPVSALFVLERLFQLVSYAPLLHQVLLVLVASGASGDAGLASSAPADARSSGSDAQPGPPLGSALLSPLLDGGPPATALMVLRLMVAVLLNKHVSPLLLAALDLTPRRHLLHSRLPLPGGADADAADAHARLLLCTAHQWLRQQQGEGHEGGDDGAAAAAAAAAAQGLCTWLVCEYQAERLSRSSAGAGVEGADPAEPSPASSDQHAVADSDPLSPLAAPAAGGVTGPGPLSGFRPQLLAALLRVLQAPLLPAMGLWLSGWLLHQLLPLRPAVPPSPSGSPEQAHPTAGSAGSATAAASVLSSAQELAIGSAASAALDALLCRLGDMWCEALFPLLTAEWPRAREHMLRPVLHASSEGLLSGPQCYPLMSRQGRAGGLANGAVAAAGGGVAYASSGSGSSAGGSEAPQLVPGQEPGLSQSARAALAGCFAVQRAVALHQLQQLLWVGTLPLAPPLPALSDVELKQLDIQEGYKVDLQPGSALPCIVSFAPGQERRVVFAVAGLAPHKPNAGKPVDAAAQSASLLRSLPVIVLADPSPGSSGSSGVVVSVAPLLGADPRVDDNVPKWLHVHVRPSVRGLLRVLKVAGVKKGGVLSAMRQLADGHWVLAFPDAERAAAARDLVQRHTSKLRARYLDVLSRTLQPLGDHATPPGGSGDAAGDVAALAGDAPSTPAAHAAAPAAAAAAGHGTGREADSVRQLPPDAPVAQAALSEHLLAGGGGEGHPSATPSAAADPAPEAPEAELPSRQAEPPPQPAERVPEAQPPPWEAQPAPEAEPRPQEAEVVLEAALAAGGGAEGARSAAVATSSHPCGAAEPRQDHGPPGAGAAAADAAATALEPYGSAVADVQAGALSVPERVPEAAPHARDPLASDAAPHSDPLGIHGAGVAPGADDGGVGQPRAPSAAADSPS